MLLKKIFIISAVIMVFISIFSGIYFLVFKKSPEKIIKNEPIKEKSFESLETVSLKIASMTSGTVISAAVNIKDGSIYYYSNLDGTLWNITERGTNATKISDEKLLNIKSIDWSNDSQLAIITFSDGHIVINNHQTGEQINLKENIDSAGWSNINDKIIYKYFDENKKERSLNSANLDGSNWKKIVNLDFRHVSFQSIPHSIQIAFWSKPDSSSITKLFKTNITSLSEPQKIFGDKFGADFLFSPDGSKFIVSYVNEEGGQKMNLGIANSQGEEFQDLQIPTLIQKVVWSKDSKTIYYAQPSGVSDGSVMPNDYLNKKFVTQDTFWKMEIATGKKERLVKLEELIEQLDATNLFLSKTEDALFFINRANGLLYRLSMD
ncbi:MAG: hypothetical protein KAT32_00255 [Candidatus Moranbacteria bacterium]|nr:hypothetical protein [Candidatus Moranbacteria bacterium]